MQPWSPANPLCMHRLLCVSSSCLASLRLPRLPQRVPHTCMNPFVPHHCRMLWPSCVRRPRPTPRPCSSLRGRSRPWRRSWMVLHARRLPSHVTMRPCRSAWHHTSHFFYTASCITVCQRFRLSPEHQCWILLTVMCCSGALWSSVCGMNNGYAVLTCTDRTMGCDV